MPNRIAIFVVTICIPFILHSQDTLINVETPYTWDESLLKVTKSHNIHEKELQKVRSFWRLRFSNNVQVSAFCFYYHGAWMTHDMWWWIDFSNSPVISSGYRTNSSFEREHIEMTYLSGSATYCGHSNDTVWDTYMFFPESLKVLDTIVLSNGEVDRDSVVTNVKIHGHDWVFYDEQTGEYSFHQESVGCAGANFFVETEEKRKMLFQLLSFTKSGEDIIIRLRWATDSCGNGVFKIDPVGNNGTYQKKYHANGQVIQTYQTGSNVYLRIQGLSDTDVGYTARIYNSRGREVLVVQNSNINHIDISDLAGGIYIAKVYLNKMILSKKFSILY